MPAARNDLGNSIRQDFQSKNLDQGSQCLQQQRQNNSNIGSTSARHDENDETTPLFNRAESSDGDQGNAQEDCRHSTAANIRCYTKTSVYWLLPAFFPYCLAYGSALVPQTYLVQDLICRRVLAHRPVRSHPSTFTSFSGLHPSTFCDDDDQVQADTAMFCLWANLVSGILTAIVTPHLGALSDRVGRKPVMIFSNFGAVIGAITVIVVGRNSRTLSMNWLLLGFVADGLCGSLTSIVVLCNAYTSDCTPPRTRNIALGHFQATVYAGVALGPIVGGAMIRKTNNILAPFYFALGCHLFFILFTYFIVPESLSRKEKPVNKVPPESESGAHRRGLRLRDLNIFAPLSILLPKSSGSSSRLRRNLVILATIDTMTFGIALSTLQILILFARRRFHWDPVEASGYLSIVNVCKVALLVLLPPILTRYVIGSAQAGSEDKNLGSDVLDLGIIRFAVLFETLGYVGYAFAPSGLLFTLSGIVACVGSLASPALQSSLTKAVPAEMSGRILGALGFLHALARIVAPVVVNTIYSNTVAWFTGFVFLCLGTLLALGVVISWLLRPGLYLHGEAEQISPD